MRIVSGSHKGRVFNPPKNIKARPTTDYAKESLFNVLNNYFDFEEISILDLFGGTGSISYEFASRGCSKITCIEGNFNHIKFIKQTALSFGFNQIKAIKYDVFKYINKCTEKYDIIFADPPYELPNLEEIPNLILNEEILAENGWLIVEHPRKISFSKHSQFKDHRIYGNVNFSVFER